MKFSIASLLLCLLALNLPLPITGQFIWDVNCNRCENRPCRWWDIYCWFCARTADAAEGFIDIFNGKCSLEDIDWGTAAEQLITDGKDKLVELNIYDQAFVDSIQVDWCESLSDLNVFGFTPSRDKVWMDDHWLTQPFTEFVFTLVHEFTHINQWRTLDGETSSYQLCTLGEIGIEDILNGAASGQIGLCFGDYEGEACDAAEEARECIETEQNCPAASP